MEMTKKILLIEDSPSIVKGLVFSLKTEGYEVENTDNLKDAEALLNDREPNLIILDITLKDGSGLDLFERHISNRKVPVIFLTARDDEETIVKGLTLGAEDYMTKPFRTKELLVRIDKIFRRYAQNTILRVRDISFDMDKMEVYKDSRKIELTSLELKILHLLFLNIDRVVQRNAIIEKVWEWTGNDIEDNTVTVYMKRIREKLDSDIIKTLKGIGYRIDKDEK